MNIHFVTGRLAEFALRKVLAELAPKEGFDYSVGVLGITVAALMTPEWVARHLRVPPGTTKVLLPGYCYGDLSPVEAASGVPVERGPKDLHELPRHFGGARVERRDYGRHDIEIIAEINHCPRLSLEEILKQARTLAADGADRIDVGCDPGGTWSGVADVVAALKAEGHRVSIDSLNPAEISPGVRAGAELVLSVNSANRQHAADWGCEVVVVPDEPQTLAGLDETVEYLAIRGVPLKIDPVLEPIGFGFARSLARYQAVRTRYPDAEMMMGIGNLTELTDADSGPINVLLLGFCQELGIRSVLTTQVINWARSSVRECDLARRLVHYAVEQRALPKHVEPKLVALRDPQLLEYGADELDRLAQNIKDHSYRLFAERGELHLVAAGLHLHGADPFELFEKLQATGAKNLDPSHSFYLGYEMAKALTALTLGKQYRQDQPLDWGFLTASEQSHRERKTASRSTSVPACAEPTTNPPPEQAGTLVLRERDAAAPLVEELHGVDAEQVFWRLADKPHCLFLDSARRDPVLGRYSFLSADPFAYFEYGVETPGAFDRLAGELARFASPTLPDLPPFQGGAAGVFSYDLGRQLEHLPAPRIDEFGFPALAVGIYDVVVAFDHQADRCWLISHGWPEHDPHRRRDRAAARLRQFKSWLAAAAPNRPPARASRLPIIEAKHLAPQFATASMSGLTSNFSREAYLRAVERAIEYIASGDIFQVNLAQRLLHPAADDAASLYLRLRRRNPAPFAGYFDLGDFQIASASPERFLQVRDRQVEARPIKGTRQRTRQPEADLFAGDELQASEKDRAENVMIVDLLRNDLARVCRPESVEVAQLCGLETYAFVQHLVSAVRGTLRDDCRPLDLLKAAFPGGSITGAPKVRAMEIIAELEPTARGAYCGALGYLGFDGSLDTNLLIRTITAGRGWRQLPVGGGIVYQSSPALEYEETWHKAEGLIRSLG